jgi:GAF domain-containing protein
MAQGEPIGTLLVGPRPDGRPVGKDEREALEEIADPIARAIRIVRLRERREIESSNALARLRDELGERISALEALMRDGARGSHRDIPVRSL